MTAATAIPGPAERLRALALSLSPRAMAWAAFAMLAVTALLRSFGGLETSLGDTDDATRLVQVRALLEGAPWFHPSLARLNGGVDVVSHWSRLVDLPIAALIWVFGLVLPPHAAEIVARTVWPLFVLLPAVLVLAYTVDMRGGRAAVACALAQLVFAPFAFAQFNVGRIDHHNVQILCAVGAALLMWASLPAARHAHWAGALAGLSLAVGYEALPLVALTSAAVVVWGLADRDAAQGAARFVAGLALALLGGLVLTVPPARWLDVQCDTLSLNLVALAATGLLGCTAALQSRAGIVQRLVLLGGFGAVGLVLYLALEPACLAGPFGQVPQGLKPIWLDHVQETFSLWRMMRARPGEFLSAMLFLAAGCLVQFRAWHRTRSASDVFLGGLLVTMTILGFAQVKFLPYASWLALPAMALFIARLPGTASLSVPAVRMAVTLLSSQLVLMVGIDAVADIVKPAAPRAADAAAGACFKTQAVAALSGLPAGLVVADLDLGPYIIATTPHTALSGPYHRLAEGIFATQDILGGSPEEARRLLREKGARYVAVCPGLDNPGIDQRRRADHLAARLARDDIPDFLEPLALPGTPLRVYRVRP